MIRPKNFKFSLMVALKYLLSGRSEAAIKIITVIAIIGVAIGVITINVVMAVMTGFQYELREKILGADAHIVVRSVDGTIGDWSVLREKMQAIQEIVSISPFTHHQALIRSNDKASGIVVRGVERGSDTAKIIEGYLEKGESIDSLFSINDPSRAALSQLNQNALNKASENADENCSESQYICSKDQQSKTEQDPRSQDAESVLPGILIGGELSHSLSLFKGSVISLLAPQVTSTPFGLMPKFRRFKIDSIYRSGLIEYENGLAYIDLKEAQRFFKLGNSISGFEVRVRDINNAPQIAKKINELIAPLQPGVFSQDWTQTNKAFFDALALEKKVYFIVLLLIIVMASFSIVSSLVMVVIEKRKDIAILRTIGATGASISNIFRIQGAIIGGVGVITGLLFSYIACIALREYGFPIDEKIFQMSTLPVRIDPINFAMTGAAAFFICCISTLYPSKRSSQIEPIEILRYQ
jgi:lipoprotein-releasing system permease protein